nr:MAG TPA: hypothetical protein [Bacteriophage sp.]
MRAVVVPVRTFYRGRYSVIVSTTTLFKHLKDRTPPPQGLIVYGRVSGQPSMFDTLSYRLY